LLKVDEDARPAPSAVEPIDRWILSRLAATIDEVTAEYDAFQFSNAAKTLYAFLWNEVCDWYIEALKLRLYGDDPVARRQASEMALFVLERTLALLHPLMPFVTEEVYGFVPNREGLLAVRRFPVADEALVDEEAERRVEAVIDAIQALRRYREEIGAPAADRIAARVVTADSALYAQALPTIARLARFDLEIAEPDGALGGGTIAIPGATVEVRVDAEAGQERRREQVKKLRQEIERAEGKLANRGFVEKAPPELVEQEREKLERYRRELGDLEG
jgi:valyl-tRNA synthetase